MTLEVSLTHRFDAFSLQVEVTAAAGITAIFGRSGAGKTTLANAVAGLVSPAAGRISLAGVVLAWLRPAPSMPASEAVPISEPPGSPALARLTMDFAASRRVKKAPSMLIR